MGAVVEAVCGCGAASVGGAMARWDRMVRALITASRVLLFLFLSSSRSLLSLLSLSLPSASYGKGAKPTQLGQKKTISVARDFNRHWGRQQQSGRTRAKGMGKGVMRQKMPFLGNWLGR